LIKKEIAIGSFFVKIGRFVYHGDHQTDLNGYPNVQYEGFIFIIFDMKAAGVFISGLYCGEMCTVAIGKLCGSIPAVAVAGGNGGR